MADLFAGIVVIIRVCRAYVVTVVDVVFIALDVLLLLSLVGLVCLHWLGFRDPLPLFPDLLLFPDEDPHHFFP